MQQITGTDEWRAHQLRMSSKAVKRIVDRPYTVEERLLVQVMRSARARCINGNKNYGGRGIEFRFDSVYEAAMWVINNLGVRPSPAHSIDRIDNNGHYEAGNLRWATVSEQNLNKRAYKVGAMGERIRKLQRQCDYSYESIRAFIKQGLSDDEIINRQKWSGCGKKHSTRL